MVFKTIDDPNKLGGKNFGDWDSNLGFIKNIKDKIYATPTSAEIDSIETYKKAILGVTDAYHAGAIDGQRLKDETEKLGKSLPTDRLRDYATTGDAATKSQTGFKMVLNKTTVAAGATKAMIIGLNAAANMGIMFLVSGAITLLVKSLDKWIVTAEEASEISNEVISTWKNQSTAIGDNIESVENMREEFEKLSRGVDENGKNVALSAEQYERYQSVVSKVAELNPSLVKGYNDERVAILDKNIVLDETIAKLERELELEDIKLLRDKKTLHKDAKNDINTYEKIQKKSKDNFSLSELDFKSEEAELARLQQLRNDVSSGKYDKERGVQRDQSDIDTHLASIDNMIAKTEQRYNVAAADKKQYLSETFLYTQQINDRMYEYFASVGQATLNQNSAYKDLDQNLKNIVSSFGKTLDPSSLSADEYTNELYKIVSEIDSLSVEQKEALNKLFTIDPKAMSADAYVEQVNNLLGNLPEDLRTRVEIAFDIDNESIDDVQRMKDEITSALDISSDDIGKLSIDDLKLAYINLADLGCKSIDELSAKLNELRNAPQSPVSFDLSSEISSLSNLETKYSSLTSAKEELLKNGKISADTGKALVDNDLLQYLDEVDGQLQINTTRFLEDAQAKKKNALLALQNAMYNDILNVALGNTELYSKTAKGALDELSSGISNASSQAGFAIPNVVGFASTVEMAKKAASGQKININTADITARINAVTNAYKPQFTLLENIDTSLEGIGKTAEQTAQDISQAMSKAKSNIESLLSTVISMIKQRYNDQKDGIQKEIDALQERYNLEKDNLDEISEKQKKVFADEKKALEDKKDALKKELDYRLEALKIQQEERSYEKELEEKNKSISDIRTSIAVIKDDNSLEGIAKRKELEEKLAEALSALEDTQFENSIKKQEDALNKEYNDFEEQTETKLDLLDQEEQAYETFHQNRLNESEQRFNDAKSKLEAQIADIDEKTKYEGYIRLEAMRLIDAGGQELYNNLLEYNRKYGDGVDSTITTSWANAYSALKEFDAGQNSVLATLNSLITKMDEYDRSISNAADSAKKLDDIIPGGAGKPPEEDEKEKKENAAKRAKLQSMLKMSINELKTVPPSAKEYKVIRQTIEDLKKQIAELHHMGIDSGTAGGIVKDLQDNEVIAKLTKGEIIITPEQAHTAAKNVENIQSENAQLANIHSIINSIPKDEMQQRIAALLNNNSQEIASIQLNSIRHSIEAMQNKLPSYSTNAQNRQIEVKQGNIVINGGANESIIPIIRKEINRSMDKISNYLYEDMQSVKTEKIQTRG